MARRFRILVVDDEQINIKVLTLALKNEYDVHSAQSGCDAIIQLREHKPDLIILDVMMPEMDGYDVCCIIKSDTLFVDIPVIFLASFDSLEGELRGLELGGIDYLKKPVHINLLKLRVRNHLEVKERNDLVLEQRDLLARKNEELEAALARIRRLEGVIPICMHCKNIRSDDASWQKLEDYISNHSEAIFSHGICPGCIAEHYPNLL